MALKLGCALLEGFPPGLDLGNPALGAYRGLGHSSLPISWGSLAGVSMNPLLQSFMWDSLPFPKASSSKGIGKNCYAVFC